MESKNKDIKTIEGFGEEWKRFDQSNLSELELRKMFLKYFHIFPWDSLPKNPIGFDMGCGSGRWAKLVAKKVAGLHCIDPSKAIEIAKKNLRNEKNCYFHMGGVDDQLLPDGSMDFGYSLGVLHHIPNTLDGITECVRMLKPGAPLLLYLYYSLDNRPAYYRLMWKASNLLRKIISRLPRKMKFFS